MMSKTVAASELTIFWKGEEMSGFPCYAIEVDVPEANLVFPQDLWPNGTEVKGTVLRGDWWRVFLFDVKIVVWPENWLRVIEQTLTSLVQQGSKISWVGLGDLFAEPPDLFDPASMEQGVLVALSSRTGFLSHPHPDGTIDPLTNDDLLTLRSIVM